MKVKCIIEETVIEADDGREVEGLRARCTRCPHSTESQGTEAVSVLRCLVFLRKECPRGENNYYFGEEAT